MYAARELSYVRCDADPGRSWRENASVLQKALGVPENQVAEWNTWMRWLLADKLKDHSETAGELTVYHGLLQHKGFQESMAGKL